MDRTKLAEIRGEIDGLKAAVEDYPALASLIDVKVQALTSELARGTKEVELQEALVWAVGSLPLDNDQLSNVLFRKTVLAVDGQALSPEMIWVAEVNHACQIKAGKNSTGNGKTSIRTISVLSINGDRVIAAGTFKDGAAACRALGLDANGDSAVRVLEKNGYIVRKS